MTSAFDISRTEAQCPEGNAAAASARDQVAKGTTSMRCKLSFIGRSWGLQACRGRSLPQSLLGCCDGNPSGPKNLCSRLRDPTVAPQADLIDGSSEKGKRWAMRGLTSPRHIRSEVRQPECRSMPWLS